MSELEIVSKYKMTKRQIVDYAGRLLPALTPVGHERLPFCGLAYHRKLDLRGPEGEARVRAYLEANGFKVTEVEEDHYGEREVSFRNKEEGGIEVFYIVPTKEAWFPDERDNLTDEDLSISITAWDR